VDTSQTRVLIFQDSVSNLNPADLDSEEMDSTTPLVGSKPNICVQIVLVVRRFVWLQLHAVLQRKMYILVSECVFVV